MPFGFLSSEKARRRTISPQARAQHAQKVERISADLKRRPAGTRIATRKGTVSHQVPKGIDYKKGKLTIDVSDLDQILEIDPVARTCVAEAGVRYEDLVAATLPHGLIPFVVPELRTITIGGAIAGCSIESTSFRHGGFHDSCFEYEFITTRGEVMTLTPDNEHAELFQMVHSSFGTLGILSMLKFRLMPAKPYVKVTYEKYTTPEEYLAAFDRIRHTREDVVFIDGMIHSPTEHVLSLGTFVDEAPYTNAYDWMKIYFRSTRERTEDYLTTEHYLFRYDRGVTNVHPKSWLGRLLFGKWLSSDRLLRIAEKLDQLLYSERPTITVDVFVPQKRVPEFLAWYREVFEFYPLWFVPYRFPRRYEWLADGYQGDTEVYVDLAIYGMEQKGELNYHAAMEQKLLELGGFKTLISHNYFSEEDFWRIWHRERFRKAKARTDPDGALDELWHKTCRVQMGHKA